MSLVPGRLTELLRGGQGSQLSLHDIRETVFDGSRNRMRPRSHVQFRENAFYMESYGSLAHTDDFGYLPVRLAVFDPVENRHLAQREFPDAGCYRL